MTDTQAQQPTAPPAPPNRRAITWWWIAAIFVVAVVIAAVAVIFLGRNTSPPQTSPTPAVGACGVPQGSQDVPTTTPARIEWRVTDGKTVLPFSATSGPALVDGAVARCYSRDPVGALLAASQIYGRILGPNGEDAAQVAREQLIPGPQRDRFVQSLANPSSPPDQIQWRAFKYLSYSPDVARIVMVTTSTASGGIAAVTMSMSWRDGDWKWDFESFGSDDVRLIDDAELSTYVPWSGIR